MKKGKNILGAKIKMFAAIAMLGMTVSAYSESAYATEVTGSNMSARIYQNKSEDSVVGNLLVGNQFEVISAETDDNGAVWYKVKTDFGLEGYVTEKEMNGLIQTAAIMGQQAAAQSQEAEQEQTQGAETETQIQTDQVENDADNTAENNEIDNVKQNNNSLVIGAGIEQILGNVEAGQSEETLEESEEPTNQESEEGSETEKTSETVEESLISTQEENIQNENSESDTSQNESVQIHDTQKEELQKEQISLLPVLLVIGMAVCIAGIIHFTKKIKKLK